jgi:hypothetical protein
LSFSAYVELESKWELVVSSGKQRFSQREVSRLIRASEAAGLKVARIEVKPDGSVAIIPGEPGIATAGREQPTEEWDALQ